MIQDSSTGWPGTADRSLKSPVSSAAPRCPHVAEHGRVPQRGRRSVDGTHVLPDAPLATESDVRDWLREMDNPSVLSLVVTTAGVHRRDRAESIDRETSDWLQVVRDFRTETTRGVEPSVIAGLSDPSAVLTANLTLEIDKLPFTSRSVAYRNAGSGIDELRRMVNRIGDEDGNADPGPRSLSDAMKYAGFFLDAELCPNLRDKFTSAWSGALAAGEDAVRIARNDPMSLPYAPPMTTFPSAEYKMSRLGDVWDEQDYDLGDVLEWIRAIERLLTPARGEFEVYCSQIPPATRIPVRCSHSEPGYMTYAPISVP